MAAKKEEQTVGVTVKKADDLSEWYSQIVVKSGMADYSPVSGCIIFRPNSYEVWEHLQRIFNERIRKTGHQNCYFPMLIPESLLKKEAEHVEGFTPEVAWVTHAGDSKLNEKLAIRPTSETIMYEAYSRWIRSWRDLPILLNQWNSVVRWEFKHAKPFLRTREFLWQEGHTAHATKEEAEKEVMNQLYEYIKLVQEDMAIALLAGKKTESEKFAGAEYTTTIEALMPDGKALQMGTSHLLGQNFAKAFNITFKDQEEKDQYVWQTSWGFSTRTLGALILVHGDDKGVVIPPRIAPLQAVIIPIIFKDSKKKIFAKVKEIAERLEGSLRVKADMREEYSSGWKFHEWELKGVPLRIEIGPRDLEAGQATVVKRNSGEKVSVPLDKIEQKISAILEDIQSEMFAKSQQFLHKNIIEVKDMDAFRKAVSDKKLAMAPFCSTIECEKKIGETIEGVSARCLPFERQKDVEGKCVQCGSPAKSIAVFGKSY